jgi:ATP-binding cassette subfamily C (CFTR/MRP) protein 4
MSQTSESKRRGPTQGFQYAGIFGKITYSFVNPLLRLGAQGKINERTADDFFPETDRAEPLCEEFEAAYSTQLAKAVADSFAVSSLKEKKSKQKMPPPPPPDAASILWRTFFQLYRWRLLEHLLWCFIEIAVRVGSPLLLRQFLDWLVLNNASGTEAAPTSQGWMWAGILAAFSYCYVLVHHQLFWRGMRMGMNARLQAIGAIEAKTLRLNAAAVADVTGGKIVNVVSNDVRRFDEAGTFWVFLIGGPVELIIVLVLVGLRLGFAASVAGVATLLLLIPAQAFLSRYIGRLRAATAAQTDERVRLTGEAISGILACKMLAWEDPLLEHLRAIRTKEAGFIAKMNRIRAFNMALSYAITPVVSVITFATARGTGAELTVANVFYSLALLSLPKLYCAEFFVHGVECVSELRIGVRRMAEFLATPEPPAPWHEQQGKDKANGGLKDPNDECDDAIIIREADFDWGLLDQKEELEYKPKLFSSSSKTSLVNVTVVAAAAKEEIKKKKKKLKNHVDDDVVVVVEPGSSSESTVSAVSTDDEHHSRLPTLPKLSLNVRRGELVAIVGPVGGGKSSILAALLGELQPTNVGVSSQPAVEVRGTVAYCQQIPWIMSGTVRDNILFGLPYEEPRFNAAVHAAALQDDVLSMPAGVETEIGERGISISGGQKARLSLARAAYSQAEVQLMDDPLSAVDPKVGRDLFTRCIGPGGVMEKATRVLVTHQKQYLPRCDRILVVRQGKIVEQGTYNELAARGVAEVVIAQGKKRAQGKGR